jgi:hypothetical protein
MHLSDTRFNWVELMKYIGLYHRFIVKLS